MQSTPQRKAFHPNKQRITNDGENLKVLFHKKVEGIAPGQSAAIYEGNDLIAGGFILKK